MRPHGHRREFFSEVGRGMIVAGIGLSAAVDLGLASSSAAEGGDRLDFGSLEPLVAFMQETSPDRIIGATIAKMREGTDLKTLLAAAALANARTFGGEDYIGFHTMMALAPAYHMTREMPSARAALPVLKVIHRNTSRIHDFGGRAKETLHPVEPLKSRPAPGEGGIALRAAARSKDMNLAEQTFAAIAKGSPEDAFNDLLYTVQDNAEVHRVALPYRAWDLLSLIGPQHAHALLRQSVRYCVKSERDWPHRAETDTLRAMLPRMLDQFHLAGKPRGTKSADDAWVDHLSQTIFESSAEVAAEAAASALAEGFAPEAVGEAIAMAANQLVLRDAGRTKKEVQPGKPEGSVHGDSIGVHACDSANAWKSMARVGNDRNTFACLILGAYQVAHDRVNRGGDFLQWQPRPHIDQGILVRSSDPAVLVKETEAAIRENDQSKATALVARYGQEKHDPKPVFDLLLSFAVSEDGALHAEKYYRTVSEEFAEARPAFRWRQATALARVTASEFGKKAAGYDEACEILGS